MAGALVQISAIAGCAGLTLRYVIQFIVVIWSLRTDRAGRRYALRLGFRHALRGPAVHTRAGTCCQDLEGAGRKPGLAAPAAASSQGVDRDGRREDVHHQGEDGCDTEAMGRRGGQP